ncbi:MAG: radical SAM protein, partial [Oligoflexales bacterium]|nr:radical SAM protein [Oligoflexales bacterium]
ADQEYATQLCRAVEPLGIRWSGQGSLTMAKNPELLYWLKRSGCDVLLIGIESLDEDNLRQMNKSWSIRMGERDELIRRIHDAGISIYATFVFGFDADTPDTINGAVGFAEKHGFYFSAFNHVTPFPATPLYRKLKDEGRLITEKWWMDTAYRYGYLPFHPRKMSYEDLSAACKNARKEFFKFSSIMRRGALLLSRNRNPVLSYLFLSSNLMLQREVEQRMELPIGINLDELPK